ncbi:acetate/propionate family kinase [Pseudomonas sp. BN417]|uniref:acetate/propionate family kinase n=1 Tax=Pseudomonas sp. BN417 TaxID=2567890 RepID=UPI002457CA75|nr:acetate/propionate family kinase [Pseudomonas sp. BN417]MDH4557124.1 acetate/propionate family kinase [Pseudomonas sp. BN417]
MPARNILVIHARKTSLRFALVNEAHSQFTLHGMAEGLGSRDAELRWQRGGDKDSLMIPNADHRAALSQLMPLVQGAAGGKLHGVGHHVLHGGEFFSSACRLEPLVIRRLQALAPLAPQQMPASLVGIEAAMHLLPNLPHVAVFDTAFHQTMPEHVYRLALPDAVYRDHGLRRYAFHGSSHRYVSHRAAELAGLSIGDSCWLSAHLGAHGSACAIVNGQSRDASMNLVMATRSGDIDPHLYTQLHRSLGWSLEKIDQVLRQESGLLGLSELASDMRSLEKARDQGHAGATLAVEVYCYRLAKTLAAVGCALPQLDGLIFTGEIGENSPLVRSKTVDHLKLLNLVIDREANARCVRGVAGPIHKRGHPRVLVVPTNEERQIAFDTLALLA